ncbi:hypothetical protein KTS45_12530 [Halomicroarcula limicola]|uniref:Uncharacterized protein n=1 Tax=Haloarcula limicola TaxID=1429915 RepID=A0A8J7YAR7_9EURY|nr:hypothetical protein [Halomicroarcula limicola]MBV0925023.1 hypothetical protein [Halomicroarcula limicola]
MDHELSGEEERTDSADETAHRNWRIDYRNMDERRRACYRREAGGASRDLSASLLAGGGA